jgi:hypothetical protein
LNIHGFNDEIKIHTADPLVPEPSAFQIEMAKMAIEKLKKYRSPGTDQIPAELLKARSRKFRSEISKLISSIWNKEELSEEWKYSIILPT